MVSKRSLMISAVLIVIVSIVVMQYMSKPKIGLSFTESTLDSLGAKLENLSYEDLEGVTSVEAPPYQEISYDIEELGEKIELLSFGDLEGLSLQ
ncbi:hypothetical protein JW865_07025 [Candidatus Bathyarchaeota archaeon]|nr:hypothetical protein [Candidatus Bathyarchaeota archaeon]